MSTESEEALVRKKKVRAGHQGSATRLIAQAEAAEPRNSVDLELAVANLKKKLDVLTPLDAEILELTTDDDIEAEIDHANQYHENIQRILSKLNKVLITPAPRTEHTPRVKSTPAAPTAPSTVTPITTDPPPGGVVIPATPHTHGTKVKLPKLTLPHFSGNPTRWTTFWDSYELAIHGNDELSEVDKFNYLRSLLEGSAFEVVRGLTLCC